jgi:hypothetical protein
MGHDASKRSNLTVFGGVKRAKHVFVSLPGVHLGSVRERQSHDIAKDVREDVMKIN